MGKFLLFCGVLLLGSLTGLAQATGQTAGQPFIKLSHLGRGGKPIIDLYLSTKEPTPNAEQGISRNFIFESVCLLSEAELGALLRYAETYSTTNKPDSRTAEYGTFELTLGSPAASRPQVYARRKSLAFVEGAIQVLQKQAPDPDQSEALHRLRATAYRLSASVK